MQNQNTSFINSTATNTTATDPLSQIVYVGSSGKIKALDVSQENVRCLWETKALGGPLVHIHLRGDRVYGATTAHSYCFDAHTGTLVWETVLHSQEGCDLVTSLLSQNGNWFFTAAGDSVIALNALNGQNMWHCSLSQEGGAYALLEYQGCLIVGNAGHVYSLVLSNGLQLWKTSLLEYGSGFITFAVGGGKSHSLRSSNTLFVGTVGYVLALDICTGVIRKSENLHGTGYQPVALLLDRTRKVLYAATSGEVRCYSIPSLKRQWKCKLPGMGYSCNHSLLRVENSILVGMNGQVGAVDCVTGKLLWKNKLSGWKDKCMVSLTPSTKPHIVLCASRGQLHSLNVGHQKKEIEWSHDLVCYQLITISTRVCNTNFNSITLPSYIYSSNINNLI